MLVTAIVFIPIMLLVFTSIFQNFSFNSRSSFEKTVTNETLGTGSDTYTTDYPVKEITAVYNDTKAYTNYTADLKSGLEPAEITIGADGTGAIKITYVAYDTDNGYDSWVRVYNQTFAGYKLGSMLPFILIALVVITLIAGVIVKFG